MAEPNISQPSTQGPSPLFTRPPYRWWVSEYPTCTTTSDITTPPDPPTLSFINFLHPGYDPPGNILFSLPCVDSPKSTVGPPSVTGVHHGVALAACSIIAGNSPGYLSVDRFRREQPQVQLPFDYLLTASGYYFHPDSIGGDVSPEGLLPYPICPEFRSWTFPHSRLPPEWAPAADPTLPGTTPAPSTNMSIKVLERDKWCRITASRDGLNNAHIVPKEEHSWFDQNSMSIYNANRRLRFTHLVNDVRNGLALRGDLNKSAFDGGKFVIVPKEGKMVVHFLDYTHELGILYQNRELHPIPQVAREFLYARFAWTIFPLLSGFLSSGSKHLRLSQKATVGFEYTYRLVNWVDHLKQQEIEYKKRKRGGPAVDGEVVDSEKVLEKQDLDGISNVDSDMGHDNRSDVSLLDHLSTTSSHASVPVEVDTIERLTQCWAPPDGDGEMERDRRLQELAFPEMSEEKVHGVGHVWENITWYPGSNKVEALKDILRKDRSWVHILAGKKRKRSEVDGGSDAGEHHSQCLR